jgi:hypothetical protein
MVLFPLSLLPDFFNGLCDVGLFWIICCCVDFVVFSLLHGDSGALSFHIPFFISLGRICISGHCKLVFLLWSGHGGASTARLKFCLTICVFHRSPSYPCAIPALLVLRVFIYSSLPFIHFWSFIKHSTSLFNSRVNPFRGFWAWACLFTPFLFDRDSPLHPNCFECIFMCEPEIEFLAFLAFLCLTQPRWCPLWLFIYQSLLLNSSKTTFSLSISSAWSSV